MFLAKEENLCMSGTEHISSEFGYFFLFFWLFLELTHLVLLKKNEISLFVDKSFYGYSSIDRECSISLSVFSKITNKLQRSDLKTLPCSCKIKNKPGTEHT